jgi:hypothetical protein
MTNDDPFVQYSVTALYHFTDRRNLPLIRQLGGLYSLAKLKEMQVVIPNPGGNEWSHDADKLKGMDGYVHLCFKPNHPMEHLAREDKRIGESIFLQVHPDVLKWDGVKYSAGVSNKSGVPIHTIDEAKKLIDFEILFTRTDWKNPTIQQKLQLAEKCEILVPNHIPLEFIRNIPNG